MPLRLEPRACAPGSARRRRRARTRTCPHKISLVVLAEGLRLGLPTRSLARRFAGALRSRGSLAHRSQQSVAYGTAPHRGRYTARVLRRAAIVLAIVAAIAAALYAFGVRIALTTAAPSRAMSRAVPITTLEADRARQRAGEAPSAIGCVSRRLAAARRGSIRRIDSRIRACGTDGDGRLAGLPRARA